MKPSLLFEQLIAKQDLTSVQMQEVIHSCMTGQLNDLQIATFLALMRMKGETINELTAAATYAALLIIRSVVKKFLQQPFLFFNQVILSTSSLSGKFLQR